MVPSFSSNALLDTHKTNHMEGITMTDNMKKLLELASQNEELAKKLAELERE